MKNKTSLEPCGSKTYLKDLIQLFQKAYANKSMVNGCNVPNCDNIIWSKATERFKEIDKWDKTTFLAIVCNVRISFEPPSHQNS